MTVYCIMAIDNQGGIAKCGNIPWYSTKDLQFFKKQTLHSVVVMGVNTFKTLNQPLPNRINIVITSHPEWYSRYFKSVTFMTLSDFIIFMEDIKDKDIYIIGGKKLLIDTIQYCSGLYLTTILENYDCDLNIDNLFSNFKFEHNIYIDEKIKIDFLIREN